MPRVRPLGLVSQDTRLFLDPLGISETGIDLKGFKFCAFNFRRIFIPGNQFREFLPIVKIAKQ